MITYLRVAWLGFWAGFFWEEADCGCAFTVHGPFRVRTCFGHTPCRDEITELLAQVR